MQKMMWMVLVTVVMAGCAPLLVGGGKRAFPHDVFINLELLNERRFRNGTVYLEYAISTL